LSNDPLVEFERRLERATSLVSSARRVVALTGAGVSAESGVPTFRDADGLWHGHAIEDIATPEAFQRNPDLVWEFYNQRRANLETVVPNPGHEALALLERRLGDGFTLITQNVDGLHSRAGSQRVLEIHGNIRRTRCLKCHRIHDHGLEPLGPRPTCSGCAGRLRPDVVWFHELLSIDLWAQAEAATAGCDVFLIVGTSAIVYPAAGLAILAQRHNCSIIEINTKWTAASDVADVSLLGPSGEILPKLLLQRS
jgi:NAD-dependent protein deacetylase/lipoamidase